MPKEGYTSLISKMLDNENIEIRLNTKANDILMLQDGNIYFDGNKFEGKVYYTGALDELFEYNLGELPYRSLDLILERKNKTFQDAATENYPEDDVRFTRITEYKHFLENEHSGISYIHTEYPLPYKRNDELGNVPYYPIFTDKNQELYEKYVEQAKQYSNLILLGRLAEYKYYNMDAIVLKALELVLDGFLLSQTL